MNANVLAQPFRFVLADIIARQNRNELGLCSSCFFRILMYSILENDAAACTVTNTQDADTTSDDESSHDGDTAEDDDDDA